MRTRQSIFLAILLTLAGFALAADADLSLTVSSDPSWGNMSHSEIQTLCENISFHFEKHLRPENEMNDTVNVYRSFDQIHVTLDPNPVAKYKIGMLLKKGMEIRVDDFYYFIWSLGHEICHILHNFELTTIDNPNLWFQEGIASMAGVWVLRSMADTWEHDSPFGTFVEQDGGIAYFSVNFEHFANAYLNVFPEYQYNGTGEEWLEEYEMFLREDYYKTRSFTQYYHLVSQLSFKFLHIFEDHPEAWNAVRKMPATTGELSEYMQDWYDTVDTEDKQFVKEIADIMSINVVSTLDADIVSNDDVPYTILTFTHESDKTITPINTEFEWDGWVMGVWEKYIDKTITRKPQLYYDFEKMHNLSHWMYSHAPSEIIYDISHEKYTSFSSYFLVPNIPDPTCAPSIELVVLVDDVEIYKMLFSPKNSGTLLEFDIPSGTKKFTINIDELGNNGCDHYILGEPKLYYAQKNGSLSEGINADVNNDGYVDLYDVLIVRSAMNAETSYDTDVNNDGVTDEVDLLIVKALAIEAIAKASPSKRKVKITTWGAMKSDVLK